MRRGQSKGQMVEPIARWEPDGDGEVLLMDTTALTIHLKINDRTVRRYPAAACDVRTHAPLWDAFTVADARAQVRTRTRAA